MESVKDFALDTTHTHTRQPAASDSPSLSVWQNLCPRGSREGEKGVPGSLVGAGWSVGCVLPRASTDLAHG